MSQAALDPGPPGGPPFIYYQPWYLPYVTQVISQARSAGLVVIVAMQWEPGSQEVCSVQTPTCTPPGWSNQDNIPFAGNTANNQSSTFRAWQVLAPLFANDNGVIYEALNEPGSSASDRT